MLSLLWDFMESSDSDEDSSSDEDHCREVVVRKARLHDVNSIANISTSSFEYLDVEDRDSSKAQHEKIGGLIRNRIFEKLDFKTTSIESDISFDGKLITTSLKDKGREIFRLVERNANFLLLKNIKIIVYYLNTYSKVYFHRQTGLRTVNFGSIHLFINGFRIPPYGDIGDDWLGIDRRKQQGYADYLGTREIVGRIEIQDKEGAFKIVSSREGLVDDACFRQIVGDSEESGYFGLIFRRLNKFVVDGLNWDKTLESDKEIEKKVLSSNKHGDSVSEFYTEDQDKKDKRAIGVILALVNTKGSTIESLWINPELIRKLQAEEQSRLRSILKDVERLDSSLIEKGTKGAFKALSQLLEQQDKKLRASEEERASLIKKVHEKDKRVRKLTKEVREKQREVFFHKRLLSNDLKQVVSYQHDIGLAAGTIKQNLILLKEAVLSGTKISNEKLLQFIQNISFQVNKIDTISNYVTKANFKTDSSDIDSDLVDFIGQYLVNVCKEVATTHDGSPMGVNFRQTKSSLTLKRRFKPIEIAIIIDNLLSNSRKAKATHVYVSADINTKGDLEIRFKDDGRGIPESDQENIFDFGFTTTSGSGMGLGHVASILKGLRGKISLVGDTERGAEFLVMIPK